MKMNTSNLTKNRIAEYLEQGKRFDGRKADEYREITVETGISKNAEGSARVRIGNTEVLVGVKMDTGTPYTDSPDKGNMMVTAELIPLSSERFEYGPPSIDAIELGRIVDRGVRESKLIEFEKLCIKEGEKVWTIFIDIYSMNDDGNLLDAASIGAVAALRMAKMPKYNEETEKVEYGEFTNKNIPLKKLTPIACTIYKIDGKLIVDPTREEEDASEGSITITFSEENRINAAQKSGAKEFTLKEINEAIDISRKSWKKLSQKV
ncbi:MAG: exosome complex protein Rrp42 [archaeon]|nr:exosome complex protein Rrp42 [archaeon]